MNDTESLKVTTPSDREIQFIRVFNASRKLVWEAWTNPKYLPHWMLGPDGWSMPVCEINLRPGGAQRFVWHHTNGNKMEIRGVYKEIKAPERLVSTESWGGEWPDTINTLVFTEADGRTTMTLTILYPSAEARDAALKSGMKQGMNLSFNRLEQQLQKMS